MEKGIIKWRGQHVRYVLTEGLLNLYTINGYLLLSTQMEAAEPELYNAVREDNETARLIRFPGSYLLTGA